MPRMKRFLVYRENPPAEYREKGLANPADEAQLEGCIFSDGTVAIRWMTNHRSHSLWTSFEEFAAVHHHPEYGTLIKWLD
jgi:hypothetical protein